MYKKINHLIFSALTLLLLIVSSPSTTHAENNISLNISPALLTIEAIPPANPKTSLTIENKGNNPENIQIRLIHFRPSAKEDGQIEFIPETSIPQSYKNIFAKIHLTDNGITTTNFELGPKQKKSLELQFLIPKEEVHADYYFSVVFLTNTPKPTPQSLNSSETTTDNKPGSDDPVAYSTLNSGIAANVLLSIGSKNNPQGGIAEFSAPGFLQSGPVPFTVQVKNTGRHFFTPFGRIFIKNIFGQTIGRIDVAPANVLANTSRSLTASSSRASQIIWPEKFLLGPYTATLNLALSEEGPVYNQSIMFFALPLNLAIGITASIILLTTIILRVRYKLKNEK